MFSKNTLTSKAGLSVEDFYHDSQLIIMSREFQAIVKV
jgi:hypothetical protein